MSLALTTAVWAVRSTIAAAVEALPVDDRCSADRAFLVALYLAEAYRDARGFVDESVEQVSEAVGFPAKRALSSLERADVWTVSRRGNRRVASRRRPGAVLSSSRPGQARPVDEGARPGEPGREDNSSRPGKGSSRPGKSSSRPGQPDASPPVPHQFPSRATSRLRNDLWDAVCEVTGEAPATRSEQTKVGKVVAELRAVDATPDEIRVRAAAYRGRYPRARLTATALASHWGALANGDQPDEDWPTAWNCKDPDWDR